MGREDLEVDGLAVDSLVGAGNSGCLIFDFALDVAKIGESPVRNMVELCPFVAASSIWVPVAGMGHIFGLVVGRDIDELKDEGSSSNDSTAAREKVATNNVLEDGRLSGGLGSNDNLLWRADVCQHSGSDRGTGAL